MKPVVVIEKSSDLAVLVQQLISCPHIAVDTESNSFHAYYDRICLIQISTPEEDFIIDPFAIRDLSPLKAIFDDPNLEKIFHAASNDVLGLRRDFQIRIRNLFDTALACNFLGYKQLGLSKILEAHFGVALNKRWQRYDWGKRPLIAEQLDYARLDTHYLISLRHILAAELQTHDLWKSALEAFGKACEQQSQEKTFHPGAFIQLHGARALDPAGKRILKALYIFREQEAKRRNRAPFRIMSNETLVRLAFTRPKDISEFARIKGIPHNMHEPRAAAPLLALIRKNELSENDINAGH